MQYEFYRNILLLNNGIELWLISAIISYIVEEQGDYLLCRGLESALCSLTCVLQRNIRHRYQTRLQVY